MKANHSASLKRAIVAQVRRPPSPFEQRSLAVYRRSDQRRDIFFIGSGMDRLVPLEKMRCGLLVDSSWLSSGASSKQHEKDGC